MENIFFLVARSWVAAKEQALVSVLPMDCCTFDFISPSKQQNLLLLYFCI